jgi:dipeptidyl aminopeptidase/acylaminoacyl peptidase
MRFLEIIQAMTPGSKLMRRETIISALMLLLCRGEALSQRRAITVEDCVGTRRFAELQIQISPDGTKVAYVIKAPNLRTNKNDYELYVRDLNRTAKRENGRLLLRSERLSGLRWTGDGQSVAILSQEGEGSAIDLVDPRNGDVKTVEKSEERISSYSIDDDGDVFAYAAGTRSNDADDYERKALKGFVVVPGKLIVDPHNSANSFRDSRIIVVSKGPQGKRVKRIVVVPTTHRQPTDVFPGQITSLSISPQGKYLAFYYRIETFPEAWRRNPVARLQISQGVRGTALGIYNVQTGECDIGFDGPTLDFGPVVWAQDGHAYLVQSLSPVGSSWEEEDQSAGFREGLQYESYTHLFAVEVRTGLISRVWKDYPRTRPGLVWKADQEVLLPLEGGGSARLKQDGNTWTEVGRTRSQSEAPGKEPALITNGEVGIGVEEDFMTPPDLFLQRYGASQRIILTDLNPVYREIALGNVERLEWVNKYGTKCTGLLIKPVGYIPGRSYPLVIMNVSREGFFISDHPYTTAFAPQPLANAGFVVLMASHYYSQDHQPKEYPGEIGQAYNWVAMVESAVNLLVERGLVDRTNVGLMGFSRTSWFVDFMLTHSDFLFKAASSADGGAGNYGQSWVYNDQKFITAGETELGGPPYGETFKNWLQYSPAFNAGKVQSPVLMEYIGANGRLKFGPTHAYEFFEALHRQGKPVELYFYPNGSHPLDTPWERVASLQRNLDWFRFWMRGYERPNPDDVDQYERWHKLREQQEWNSMVKSEGKDPTEEYLHRRPSVSPSANAPQPPL